MVANWCSLCYLSYYSTQQSFFIMNTHMLVCIFTNNSDKGILNGAEYDISWERGFLRLYKIKED